MSKEQFLVQLENFRKVNPSHFVFNKKLDHLSFHELRTLCSAIPSPPKLSDVVEKVETFAFQKDDDEDEASFVASPLQPFHPASKAQSEKPISPTHEDETSFVSPSDNEDEEEYDSRFAFGTVTIPNWFEKKQVEQCFFEAYEKFPRNTKYLQVNLIGCYMWKKLGTICTLTQLKIKIGNVKSGRSKRKFDNDESSAAKEPKKQKIPMVVPDSPVSSIDDNFSKNVQDHFENQEAQRRLSMTFDSESESESESIAHNLTIPDSQTAAIAPVELAIAPVELAIAPVEPVAIAPVAMDIAQPVVVDIAQMDIEKLKEHVHRLLDEKFEPILEDHKNKTLAFEKRIADLQKEYQDFKNETKTMEAKRTQMFMETFKNIIAKMGQDAIKKFITFK
jgi:hypothetical protein